MLDFLQNTQEEETMADKYAETKAKYDAENTKRYGLKFTFKYDGDVIEKLDSIENKQAYIKSLIRADIAGNSAEKMGDLIERLRAIERALDGLDI